MPRRNNRWDNHQSLGELMFSESTRHRCTTDQAVPTADGHICMGCGRYLYVVPR